MAALLLLVTHHSSPVTELLPLPSPEGRGWTATAAFAAAVESPTLPPAARDAPLSNLATVREESKLRVVAFDREVRFVPGQSLAVTLRG
jgi:hypothetical protein